MPELSKLSLERLATCHPDLQKVVTEAAKSFDFTVACGHRGEQEQDEAFARGFSKLKFPHSRHNSFPSHAVDLVPYPVDWHDEGRFNAMVVALKAAALAMGVNIECGADWVSFKDSPHVQLPKGAS